MPIRREKSPVLPLLLLVLILLNPKPSDTLSFSLSHYRTLLSLSHSLTSRVANLRSSRGDYAGSSRAQSIARKIESLQGLGFWKLSWSLGRDYLKNYAWRGLDTAPFSDLAAAVSDLNKLLRALSELSRVESDSERVAWVGRNYSRMLSVSRSLFVKLLKVFRQSGPLREIVETMQKEVVDGDLLRDCLELGANDLKDLMQILKDIALQYSPSSSEWAEL